MLLKAKPYQCGYEMRNGQTHQLDDADPSRTLCGKTLEMYPGDVLEDLKATLDCKVCLKAVETRENNKLRAAQWEAQCRERDREWQQKKEERARRYNAYLQSREWQDRRLAVLQRANWVCEGCGRRRATQVHHLTYERIFDEMLFDLRAVCTPCHEKIHASQPPSRSAPARGRVALTFRRLHKAFHEPQ